MRRRTAWRPIELHPYRITGHGPPAALDAARSAARFRQGPDAALAAASARPPGRARGLAGAWLDYYGDARVSRRRCRASSTGWTTEPRKGAAMFRNRITTMQHAEHWQDVPDRGSMAGKPALLARGLGAGRGSLRGAVHDPRIGLPPNAVMSRPSAEP
ncbi:MAG: hypothetical protein M0C28_06365 [Candidatus Moduliflexus flocculans]|nr:hypothetical protein [Candidatus Moduliflexus flocculans]